MMFDKNGRQEEISLHYKNKEIESFLKRWNGRDMAGRTCQPCKEVRVSKSRDTVTK